MHIYERLCNCYLRPYLKDLDPLMDSTYLTQRQPLVVLALKYSPRFRGPKNLPSPDVSLTLSYQIVDLAILNNATLTKDNYKKLYTK